MTGSDPGAHLSFLEDKTIDARFRSYAAPTPRTGDILILDISEESIKKLEPVYGRWPWPRSVHADVVDYLKADGAKAIGFDIIFSEGSTRQEVDAQTVDELASFARNADIPEVREQLLKRIGLLNPGNDDAAFVSAVKRAGNVFQSSVFHVDSNDVLRDRHLAADDESAKRIASALSASAMPGSAHLRSNAYFNATVPFSSLAKASRGTGHINFFPDRDGIGRRHYPFLFFKDNDLAYPSLALAMAMHVMGADAGGAKFEGDGLSIGGSALPLLMDGSLLIYYQGGDITRDPSGKEVFSSFYRHIPYEHVLESKDMIEAGKAPVLLPGTFRDKIVLISAFAAGLSDLRPTPLSPVTPGIEIHANAIDNFLSGKFLRRMDGAYEYLYILSVSAVVALICHLAGPYPGLAATAATVLGLTVAGWLSFEKGILLPMAGPVFSASATYLAMLLLKYVSEYRRRRFIQTAFGRYIAPAVLKDILRSPEKLRLGGERRQMTVLFSDIEAFTTLSDRLPPEEVSALLNEYLTSMTDCVTATAGTLDKFIGDAVMAVWNAPEEQEGHAGRACDSAILMLKELSRLRDEWRAQGRPLLNIRIGINTGEMIVGNMGSKEIFDYTVIGAEVNAASRLEPLNKEFGTRIIVSEGTRRHAEQTRPGRFAFRRLARVALKGRDARMEVHELVGLRSETGEGALCAFREFETGLGLFEGSRFTEAREHFQKAVESAPGDGPSEKYLRLCDEYTQTAPKGFDAVYVQKSK
ncbi:MAG: adenylate/guanylate cyclase domain-containing protein [Deltaproteobacteria bacterium]|nr:adenylate/guanylate cyclase domain-containing protein [Deltaproteobacteria bacterium]